MHSRLTCKDCCGQFGSLTSVLFKMTN